MSPKEKQEAAELIFTRSPELNAMLTEILKAVPAPTGGKDWQKSLIRNRLIQQLLAAKAMQAAEVAWPGFGELMTKLVAGELDFMDKAGPQC